MVKTKGKPKDTSDSKPPSDKKGTKGKHLPTVTTAGSGGNVNTDRKSARKHSNQHDEVGEKKKSTEGPLPTPKTESFKYLGLEPEWNSEEIREHKLLSDGFTCCIVLIMEDSAELTAMGHYLHHAVKTGVRKRFMSISGEEIAVKVKKFLTSSNIREPGKDDQAFWERMDIWAEAVKQKLISVKTVVATEINAKDVELTGVRSKDFVKHMPPMSFTTSPPGPEDPDEDEGREPPPVPPPTVGDKSAPSRHDGEDKHKKKKGPKKSSTEEKRKSHGAVNKRLSNNDGSSLSSGVASSSVKSRSSNMRKRGELPMPTLEAVDDSPPTGPHTYVLLQGFYDPKILEELLKIGVVVDGILLMTDAKVSKRNFSVLDIEDSIPGTFRPHNVLPNYLKRVEQQNSQPRAQRDVVGQFWVGLAECYKTISADSPLLDCALMNFELPQNQFGLGSPDARGIYASKLFDEASQRIYEMLVLSDWFHDYRASSTIKEIKPVEEELPRLIYENLLNQVPSECVTVPIIMECILEQVVANVDNSNPSTKEPNEDNPNETKKKENAMLEHEKFGRPDWGNNVVEGGLTTLSKRDSKNKSKPLGPTFAPPLYIKNGDYASIRACHLNETVAAHIASTQVAGDLRKVQALWQNVPEFNKGLYMKLLGNLNHFMYFLPPESIRFEDMFFILHLLMSAGVEVQLQKQSEKVKTTTDKLTTEAKQFEQMVHSTTTQLFSTHGDQQGKNIKGTKLDKDHNYLAVNKAAGLHFIMAPTSDNDISIAPVGHTKEDGKSENLKNNTEMEQQAAKHGQKIVGGAKRRSVTYEEDLPEDPSVKSKSLKDEQAISSEIPAKSILNTEKAEKSAGIATKKAIEAAAELASETPENALIHSGIDEDEDLGDYTEEEMEERKQKGDSEPLNSYYFGTDPKASKSKRFIACEQEWFKDLNDYSVFQSLLQCPALLAISDSGALDLSTWIESYLLSTGLSHDSGDGVLIGRLQDWNYVEELVPVQMIQLLNESMSNYLSMQRMYCPFYDTLLFIFNNPTPKELKSDTQFYYKLKTLPGLQHFLEHTINDDNVLQWLMGVEKNKGAEIIDSLSVATLMKIVPEEQWLLVPSIKYMLFKEHAKLVESNEINSTKTQIKEAPPKETEQNADKRGSLKEARMSIESEGPVLNLTDGEDLPNRGSKSKGTRRSKKSKDSTAPLVNDAQKGVQKDEETHEKRASRGSRGSKASEDDTEDGKKKAKKKSKDGSDSGTTKSKKEGKKGSKKSVDMADGMGTGNPLDPVKLDAIPSFHFNEVISGNKKSPFPSTSTSVPSKTKSKGTHFDCYDLGKRVIVAAADTYHLFPMDGSVIQYDISTIEPEFHMMQLSITKNGHQTFFYPYYIPHDLDLSKESYVVCPYFHMVHSNGTMFAFQDLRASEAAPYMKVSMKSKDDQDTIFSYEKIVFGSERDARKQHLKGAQEKSNDLKSQIPDNPADLDKTSPAATTRYSEEEGEYHGEEEENEEEEAIDDGKESGKKSKKAKGKKDKEDKKDKEKQKDGKKDKPEKASETKVKDEKVKKKGKSDKKAKRSKKTLDADPNLNGIVENNEAAEEADEESALTGTQGNSKPIGEADAAEWVYSDSEISEDDGEGGRTKRKKNTYFAPNWDDAELNMEPMSHSLKITLPSGLLVQVDDVPGPPITREVKQSYTARGSATSRIEASRYYTMNGSVIKFMLNGTIQILTARGVTTTIRELATSAQKVDDNVHEAFVSASSVRIFNGDVILPNGDFWHIVDGKKEPHDPIFVFTSGPLPNGEIFRRRQDGVVYLHRHDGTTITHYPDGTRFTTRMVVLKEPVEEFEDWVFIGLKYMVEHANYSTVIFNTLSGNLHVRLPQGVWSRVFADGSVKLSTIDNYAMDVDKHKAVLSFPPCAGGDKDIPNLTAVKLWHSKEHDQASDKPPPTTVTTVPATATELETKPVQKVEIPEPVAKPESNENIETITVEEEEIPTEKTPPTKIKPAKAVPGDNKPVTRGGRRSQKNNASKKSLRNNPKTQTKTKNQTRTTIKPRAVEGLDGEVLEEEEAAKSTEEEEEEGVKSIEEEEEQTESDELVAEEVNVEPVPEEPTSKQSKKFEIQEFIKFTDGSLLCKAVDSWDNRFAVDIYGETFVDKGTSMEQNDNLSAQELLKSFSEHCQLPQEYLSGILKMTSSEDLATAAKRISALKQSPVETNARLPPTTMFVVKRDMSGYEYFKKSQVEMLMSKAKGCRDSMVIVDPLPNRDPRKYITIMEPVSEIDKPRGTWTSNYREPAFRPRFLTNKHLQVSKVEDLRWFGYVLMAAHGKRPKYLPNPRENYLKKKTTGELQRQKAIVLAAEKSDELEVPVQDIKPGKGKGKEKSKKKSGKKDKGKKEKPSSKERSGSNEEEVKGIEAKVSKKPKSQPKKPGKSGKGKDSHLPLDTQGKPTTPATDFLEEEESTEEEPQRNPIRLDETEIKDYPEDVPDLEGVYEDEEPIHVKPQNHADVLTQKKAIVVRSFVEIPQVDEKLQRALLAASMSYGHTVENQIAAFNANSIHDPRSEEEKDNQKLIKQQLIEQNLSDMHLLEQRSGAVLRFHF